MINGTEDEMAADQMPTASADSCLVTTTGCSPERVGYGSAGTFSTAFSRYVGQPSSRYARER